MKPHSLIRLFPLFLSLLHPLTSPATPTALVLSGGGAKGAYEIGVWQALCERGYTNDLVAISGTSVGAINGVLFATVRDPEQCRAIWTAASSKAFVMNKSAINEGVQRTAADASELRNEMREKRQRLIKELTKSKGRPPSAAELKEIDSQLMTESGLAMGAALLVRLCAKIDKATDGGEQSVGVCDSSKLREQLSANLPAAWPKDAPQVYATALEKQSGKRRVFSLRGLPKAQTVDRMMASAALPGAFDSVAIDGVQYIDGGVNLPEGDNLPVDPILRNHKGIKRIIMVLIGRNRGQSGRKQVNGIEYITISPSENIGGSLGGWQGVFDVSPETSRRLLSLGYRDALRQLK